jgi:hypothetical protein
MPEGRTARSCGELLLPVGIRARDLHGADLETGPGVPDLEVQVVEPLQLHLYRAVRGHGDV